MEDKLHQDTRIILEGLKGLADPLALERERAKRNREYIRQTVPMVQNATRDILPDGLTDEQAEAIATTEDCTLVLAGAGAGKTAVIIGRIAHLVRNQGVPAGSILALALNRKAALEIRERLPEDLAEAYVSTFHSFALNVMKSAGTAPTISRMSTDDLAYSKALDAIIQRMLREGELTRTIVDLTGSMNAEYRSPFEFKNAAEYQQYTRDSQLRTLSGDLVKSFEELRIANFLTENSVEFRYEDPYEVNTATRQHRQYQPDFHLPEPKIYIEHFAINRAGQAPPGWDRYVADMEWKRQVHTDNGTTLVETYSWQSQDETLLETLQARLEEKGVRFTPLPLEELVLKLSETRISWLGQLAGQFLNHVKSSQLNEEELYERGRGGADWSRTERFLRVFRQLRTYYQELLAEENAIDFNDLINGAVRVIGGENWESPFEHVLVDEFQDISTGRMAILKALGKAHPAYFLVGDDWQSIYRFAGSQVGLLRNCGEHLGPTERMMLTKTFRFGPGILEPTGRFIQQNPEQTQRNMVSGQNSRGIIILPAQEPQEGINEAVREILKQEAGRKPSIIVLARYRSRRELTTGLIAQGQTGPFSLEFSTIHAAKGQEADYVIILDLADGWGGFPCLTENDPIMDLVLPADHPTPFPHAEERRLFYVAMTRAKRAVYLIPSPSRPSPFVRELIEKSPEVELRGELAPACPECSRGSLTPSSSRDNLRCSNHPGCAHLAPRCPGCQSGYIISQDREAHCTNPACRKTPELCPGCRQGILLLRKGRESSFWGCSRYGRDYACRYTRPAPELPPELPVEPAQEIKPGGGQAG